MSNADSVPGLQAALADLTARASDLKEDTANLGRDQLAGLMANCATPDDALEVMTDLATGYGNLAHKLLIEWRLATGRSEEHLLAALGRWVSAIAGD